MLILRGDVLLSKKIVVDTSVLIYDIESLFKFEDNHIIIPSIVCEEINKFKEESSERGFAARKIQQIFEELSKIRPLVQGVFLYEVSEDSPIYSMTKDKKTFISRDYKIRNSRVENNFIFNENDYKIIACAMNNDAILVSRDRGMRDIGADFVKVQEYKADMLQTKELYKGYRKIEVPEDIIYKMHKGILGNEYNLYPNEFVIFINQYNPSHSSVGIMKKNKIIPCDFDNMNLKGFNIKPLNLEQKMLMYLLLDEDVKCVTATGISGKGKSLMTVDFGLSCVELGKYSKFLYTKSTIAVDKKEELGFYKGGVEDKLKPHLQPLYSSIEFIYNKKLNIKGNKKPIDEVVQELIMKDTLNLFPLANIRGMSIFDKVVMLDEAQNTTQHMIKSLVTRVNDSSKLIVTGDIEQIDDRNLNMFNNGLSHLIENGKNEDFIGHITMDIDKKSKRGRLAEFGANKL